ncbi:Bifunctional bis(5'-adenosyl)-triphosphatase/adenylylsulfatase FHIT [Wickerhamiella sorbophila]|uniref:Bis(5'-adenosyl)-triphosphatase n=1 Tax=Wickerhamiella sorbophila TaxID=45607 RepID=A0A2T0FMK5_9ASCO|nr:Bifunctional bis(5'-adenosyl)-triphosphatase/adenylylsulfatase FHIT [Wickerhamiella sorbophila]PRT56222.1 Bifunctional bis(5'-adenosyl)-triphosphatase/adenylylsulfatase FHIT [Wickerhamiella sorbophila]
MRFGSYTVSEQVFYQTRKSFAIVNIRPILPGHVLVCPIRPVERFSQLNPEEVADLFQAVHSVSRAIETYYGAQALNISIQDGPLAGQSIAHVHCHIIPRRLHDLPNVDDVYKLLDENNFTGAYKLVKERSREQFTGPDNDQRVNRTPEDMKDEATRLKQYIVSHIDPTI